MASKQKTKLKKRQSIAKKIPLRKGSDNVSRQTNRTIIAARRGESDVIFNSRKKEALKAGNISLKKTEKTKKHLKKKK